MKALKQEDPASVAMREAREILLDDPKFCKRKVRCVAHENELEDKRVLALYTLAVGRKFHWTPADWKVITDKLDVCELSIAEWVDGLSNAT